MSAVPDDPPIAPPPRAGAPARSRAAVEAHITNITTALLTLPPSHPATVAHLLTRSSLYVALHASTAPTAADPPRAHYAHAALRDARHLVRSAPHLPAAWLALFAASRAAARPDDAALVLAEARRYCPHDPVLRIVAEAAPLDDVRLAPVHPPLPRAATALPLTGHHHVYKGAPVSPPPPQHHHQAGMRSPQRPLSPRSPPPTHHHQSQHAPLSPRSPLPSSKPHPQSPKHQKHAQKQSKSLLQPPPVQRRSHPSLPLRSPPTMFKSTSASTLPGHQPEPLAREAPSSVAGASLPNLAAQHVPSDVPVSPPKRRLPAQTMRTYPRLPPRQPRINPSMKPVPSAPSSAASSSKPPSAATLAPDDDDPAAHPHYHETLSALQAADDSLLLGAHDDAIATYTDVLTPRPHAPPLPTVLMTRALAARSDAALRKAVYDRHPSALKSALTDARRLSTLAPRSDSSWTRLANVHMQAGSPQRARKVLLKGLRLCGSSTNLHDALGEADAAIRRAGGDPGPSPIVEELEDQELEGGEPGTPLHSIDRPSTPTASASASVSVSASASVTPSVSATASISASASLSASVTETSTASPSASRSVTPSSQSTPSSPAPSSSPSQSPLPSHPDPPESVHLFAISEDTDGVEADPPAQRLSQLDLRRASSSARRSAPARVDERGQAALRDAALRDAHRKERLWILAARRERARRRSARRSSSTDPVPVFDHGEDSEDDSGALDADSIHLPERRRASVATPDDMKRDLSGRLSGDISAHVRSLGSSRRDTGSSDRNSTKLPGRVVPSLSLPKPRPRSSTPTLSVPAVPQDAPLPPNEHDCVAAPELTGSTDAKTAPNELGSLLTDGDRESSFSGGMSQSSGLLAREKKLAESATHLEPTPVPTAAPQSIPEEMPSHEIELDPDEGNTLMPTIIPTGAATARPVSTSPIPRLSGSGARLEPASPKPDIAPKRKGERSDQSKSSLGSAVSQQRLYELLQVPRDATEAQIKKSYYLLARRYHPDKNADDAQATDKFQKLAEAYRVLSDPESRAMYDRYGDRGLVKNSVDMIDPSTLFAMVFGSDQFVALIGELQLASLAARVDDNGNTPSEDELGHVQRTRVGKLALEMIKTLKPWVDGDKKGFLGDVHRQMRKLRDASFGPSLLYTVGNVYLQQTSYLLDKTKPFNLSAVMRKASLRSHKIASHHKAMRAASCVMDKQRKLHDRVMRSGRDNRYIAEDEAKQIAVEMAENAIDMMWKISVIDVETTLEDVLMIVLSGRDLVAEGEDFKLSDASFDSLQGFDRVRYRRRLGSHLGKERRERGERGRDHGDRPETGLVRPLPPLSHGEGATTRQQILSERAHGIQAMGRIFMSASREASR